MNKKGFTLVELMIVVVILGVLMATVLPRLTGAQARARDTGREADLNNIAQALQVYYDDNGQYPAAGALDSAATGAATGECLGTTQANSATSKISGYLKGSKVPTDPLSEGGGSICTGTAGSQFQKGSYYYLPIKKNGIDFNGYVLCADVETIQKANTSLAAASLTSASTSATTYDSLDDNIGTFNSSTEPAGGALDSAFCILN